MKRNHDGFSLVEIVAAIAILGIFFGTACSALVLGLHMNERTDAKLQAQLAVSTAVETLMAEGIDPDNIVTDAQNRNLYDDYPKLDNSGNQIIENGETVIVDRFPKVSVTVQQMKDADENALHCFEVTVSSQSEAITIVTNIREKVVTKS